MKKGLKLVLNKNSLLFRVSFAVYYIIKVLFMGDIFFRINRYKYL